jgi:hypothetical protein
VTCDELDEVHTITSMSCLGLLVLVIVRISWLALSCRPVIAAARHMHTKPFVLVATHRVPSLDSAQALLPADRTGVVAVSADKGCH